MKREGDLPDPLMGPDGVRAADSNGWRRRREEVAALLRREMYGRSPQGALPLRFELREHGKEFDGHGIRRQVRVQFGDGEDAPGADILLYLPATNRANIPAFAALNFGGNWTVAPDPGVLAVERLVRGAAASRWPIELILARGYAIAIVNYNDFAPDDPTTFRSGVARLYPELDTGGDRWSAIGMWGWGLSRVLDYLETVPGAYCCSPREAL